MPIGKNLSCSKCEIELMSENNSLVVLKHTLLTKKEANVRFLYVDGELSEHYAYCKVCYEIAFRSTNSFKTNNAAFLQAKDYYKNEFEKSNKALANL